MDLFRTVSYRLGHKDIIAEDLGFMTDSVKRLVEESGYPNMKVIEFAFDERILEMPVIICLITTQITVWFIPEPTTMRHCLAGMGISLLRSVIWFGNICGTSTMMRKASAGI